MLSTSGTCHLEAKVYSITPIVPIKHIVLLSILLQIVQKCTNQNGKTCDKTFLCTVSIKYTVATLMTIRSLL